MYSGEDDGQLPIRVSAVVTSSGGIAIRGRALEHVGDINVLASQAAGFDDFRQELTGLADERLTLAGLRIRSRRPTSTPAARPDYRRRTRFCVRVEASRCSARASGDFAADHFQQCGPLGGRHERLLLGGAHSAGRGSTAGRRRQLPLSSSAAVPGGAEGRGSNSSRSPLRFRRCVTPACSKPSNRWSRRLRAGSSLRGWRSFLVRFRSRETSDYTISHPVGHPLIGSHRQSHKQPGVFAEAKRSVMPTR